MTNNKCAALIVILIFLNITVAGATNILITSWDGDSGAFALSNVNTSTTNVILKNATIGSTYFIRYENGTAITYDTASSTTLNLSVNNLQNGSYLITTASGIPTVNVSAWNATTKIVSVTNLTYNNIIFNISDVTNGYRYTMRDSLNNFITSGYAQNSEVTFNVYGLADGTYYIYMESVGATVLINRDNILTKQLNISYIPAYNGEAVNLAYNVNESYVFINLRSTSSVASATDNGTHLIITDVVSDVGNVTYYNVTAIRSSTITRDATYIIATVIIGGTAVHVFRKRR
jgi:hypothetical protein